MRGNCRLRIPLDFHVIRHVIRISSLLSHIAALISCFSFIRGQDQFRICAARFSLKFDRALTVTSSSLPKNRRRFFAALCCERVSMKINFQNCRIPFRTVTEPAFPRTFSESFFIISVSSLISDCLKWCNLRAKVLLFPRNRCPTFYISTSA